MTRSDLSGGSERFRGLRLDQDVLLSDLAGALLEGTPRVDKVLVVVDFRFLADFLVLEPKTIQFGGLAICRSGQSQRDERIRSDQSMYGLASELTDCSSTTLSAPDAGMRTD